LRDRVIGNEARLKVWLDDFEVRLEKMAVAYNQASFDKYCGGSGSKLDYYDAAFSSLLADETYHANVQHWHGRVTDLNLQRRLALNEQSILEAEVSKNPAIYELRNRINDRMLSYQPRLGQQPLSRSDIVEILRSETNRAYRQQVYEQALRPLSEEVEPLVIQLISHRNNEARRLGYDTYADLHLALLDLNRPDLMALLSQLENLTTAPYQAFLQQARQEFGLDRVQPWDLQWLADRRANLPDHYFPHQRITNRVNELLTAFGLNPAQLPIQLVRQDIPFGGLCFTVRVPHDIRILCNPKDGYPYYRTLFHEYGHALHAAFNRQPNYIFKREWGVFSEGMAETLAYFTQYDEWLIEVGLTASEVTRYQHENSARRILRIRNLIAQTRFEIEAYDQPAADLNRLLAEGEAHYLQIPLDLTPRWAAVSYPTTHPIYRQNYLLAELIAAQTHATLRQRFGNFFQLAPADKTALFSFLQEQYYAPGATLPWPEKIRRATGQPLNIAALATELEL
jgi:oligoendopeptidase F